ncbi:putative E3 ubiquitin-protein ligase RF298 [Heracleum sosnowskyi]|uniref:E3 ubiquitin-protein ligase RF298 n=1 Tax=Heracleum sosnowskyi TaxID=360622 RepID=A0AAD8GQZ4_9APIA|nr:putative E3 ubiquitin-protein ligase RF298 [Heracleum sosnowskyi]
MSSKHTVFEVFISLVFAICVFTRDSNHSPSLTTKKLEVLASEILNLSRSVGKDRGYHKRYLYINKNLMAKSSDGNIFNQSSSSESVKEAGSKNKRKHSSECASHVLVEEMPLSLKDIPSYELIDEKLADEFRNLELLDEKIANENSDLESARGSSDIPTGDEVKEYLPEDWDDPSECQFEELLSSILYTTFRNAVKKMADYGHSEEDAEQVVLRRGFCHGDKDPVSNIVEGALPFLERKQEVDLSKYQVFDNVQNMQHLVEYTMVEMVNLLREIKPSLSVSEAMWSLLICDLNVKKACAMEPDVLSGLRSEAVSGGISFNSVDPQIKSDVKTYQKIPSNTSKSAMPNPSDPRKSQTNIPSEGESSNSHSVRIPFPGGFITTNAQSSNMEDASGVAKKCCSANSKRELLRQRTLHMEKCRGRMSMPRGAFKSKLTSISCSVMEKKSVGYMKNVSYKESTAAQAISVPTTATSSTPARLPVKDVSAADDKNSKLISPETKPPAGSQISTVTPSKTPDYFAGIPYDKSTNKYLPQNKRQELLLALVAKKEAQEKEIQHWSDWTTKMVRQAAQRLGKDKEELKALRQEKEEEEKLMKDKQILEENTMKRLAEMECALTNANRQTEMANSSVSKLEQKNLAMKQKLESAKLLALKSSEELQEAVLKEHATLKKVQLCDSEKEVLLENLKSYKNKGAKLNKDLKKAEVLCKQNEALWKQEEREKEKILAQASSVKKERERLEALSKEERRKIKQKADCELEKYKDNMKELEEQISKLRMDCESSRVAALREGINRSYVSHPTGSNIPAKPGYLIPNVYKRLPVFQGMLPPSESVKANNRECSMCMVEDISVIFLPCAHQVLCEECNERHEKDGATTCPICRALIQTRFKPQFYKRQNN